MTTQHNWCLLGKELTDKISLLLWKFLLDKIVVAWAAVEDEISYYLNYPNGH